MKKLIYLIVLVLILGLIVTGCIPVVPPVEKDETSSLKKPGHGNGINLTGYHYNLNLIGKKADWSGSGNYEGKRHTMFVPESTEGLSFTVGSFDPLDGIKISMTQGTEFEVVDGNWFDDEECAFQLGFGKYRVFIVAKAKPHPNKDYPDGYYTDITGWVYCEAFEEYLFDIGEIKVGRKLSKKFTSEEKFRLSDQMVRSSRSSAANIAEGHGRFHFQENIQFCRQSRGSLFELIDHIMVAQECGYIDSKEKEMLIGHIITAIRLLNGYIKYLNNRKYEK